MTTDRQIVGGSAGAPLIEVIGNLDGQPIFLGRMTPNRERGGFSMSDNPEAIPNGGTRWFWSPSEEGAVRWMKERKGL